MIKSVLINLVINAIKFTNASGEIVINALQKNGHIEISVSDNGVGMCEDRLNKLFKTEIPETTIGTESESGSGLGLIICKEFVEIHGGKIWVESKEGEGSIFRFTIPNS